MYIAIKSKHEKTYKLYKTTSTSITFQKETRVLQKE